MLNVDYLRGLELPAVERVITDKDAMLYALSIGLSADALDRDELRYTYENDLIVSPTMPLMLCHPGRWMPDPRTGIDYTKVVHGSQRLECLAPLKIGRPMIGINRVTGFEDKGEKGAIITLVREIKDAETGEILSRGESGVFCRADGGFGVSENSAAPYQKVPARDVDAQINMPTADNLALLYRLNQDRNPLHADPDVAKKAGFSRPILHGLATFGLAATALTRHMGGKSLASIEARFSRPVMPGETVSIDIWDEGGGVAFRARIAERDVTVLDMGRASFR